MCDPRMAGEFDRYVLAMLPDEPSSFKIRWFAMRIRKRAKDSVKASAKLNSVLSMARKREAPFGITLSKVPAEPGLYWLSGDEHLYVGETENLRERFEVQFNDRNKFDFWKTPLDKLQLRFKAAKAPDDNLSGQQSHWISKWRPIGNYERLAAQQ